VLYDPATPSKEALMHRVLPLLGVLCLSFAPAPEPNDLQQLQGEWVPVSSVLEGGTVTIEPDKDILVFKGRRLSFVSRGTASARWTVILGPSRKPKTIDLRGDDPTDSVLGIYRLEGDTLTICNGNSDGARPADFVGRRGVWLAVYKRSKR
jgi:uncharacterized protein (TIGR03067 family)